MFLLSGASLILCIIIVKTSAVDQRQKLYSQAALLYTGYTLDIFHGLGKHFFIRPHLNNFTKIGYNLGPRFLRTAGILFQPVDSVDKSENLSS